MILIFESRSFLFQFVCLIELGPKFMQEKTKFIFFLYMLLLQLVLINGQWHTFFSNICVNYIGVNFVRAKGCKPVTR